MIRISTGNLRAAAIVAAATAALAGGSALAAQVSPPPSAGHSQAASHPSDSAKVKASKIPEGQAPSKPEVNPNAKPSEKSDPSDKPEASEPPEAGESDAHGKCVSAVAENHSATATRKNGKTNHGAAVSKAAHDCPK